MHHNPLYIVNYELCIVHCELVYLCFATIDGCASCPVVYGHAAKGDLVATNDKVNGLDFTSHKCKAFAIIIGVGICAYLDVNLIDRLWNNNPRTRVFILSNIGSLR